VALPFWFNARSEMKCIQRLKGLVIRQLKAIRRRPDWAKESYAQCGEDLIIDYILRSMGISCPRYLDIGASHPIKLNNTYLFYERGSCGLCIEPDPTLHAELQRIRPRDVSLNIGCGGAQEESATYWVLEPSVLSTFSEEESRRYVDEEGARVLRSLSIPLVPLTDILRANFTDVPELVSVDVEGLELEILQAVDMRRYRPKVFCVETLSYSAHGRGKKVQGIFECMRSQGYMVWGDTYINTIFVDEDCWQGRKRAL